MKLIAVFVAVVSTGFLAVGFLFNMLFHSCRRSTTKDVKILGPGCKRCDAAGDMVKAEAARLGIEVHIDKVTDYAAIAGYGIASTDALNPAELLPSPLRHR